MAALARLVRRALARRKTRHRWRRRAGGASGAGGAGNGAAGAAGTGNAGAGAASGAAEQARLVTAPVVLVRLARQVPARAVLAQQARVMPGLAQRALATLELAERTRLVLVAQARPAPVERAAQVAPVQLAATPLEQLAGTTTGGAGAGGATGGQTNGGAGATGGSTRRRRGRRRRGGESNWWRGRCRRGWWRCHRHVEGTGAVPQSPTPLGVTPIRARESSEKRHSGTRGPGSPGSFVSMADGLAFSQGMLVPLALAVARFHIAA